MVVKSSKTKDKMPPADKLQLSTLIDMESPDAVHNEVIAILNLIDPLFDWQAVDDLFHFTSELYSGRHPQYKACDTDYHDFRHVTDTYLAIVRMIHGAIIEGEIFLRREIILGLAGTLLHDSGLIKHKDDRADTGADYVKDHVQRSMDFIKRHAADLGLSAPEVEDVRSMILCTDLGADLAAISFNSRSIAMLGKMLGTADLIGQMADRTYLEKLLFLFHEFRKAEISDCEDEVEFLYKTLDFYKMCDYRFDVTLERLYRLMVPHFQSRWDVHINLYTDSLNKQRDFLKKILADQNGSPYDYLKRSGIVREVRRKFGELGLKTGD
ncbi:MAG: hypothetical protein ACQES8_07405 [Thermodesulfobacteriota bacterium]